VNSALNPVIRGQVIQLYGTGQGPVPNAPPDGQAATGAVPTPTTPQVAIGSSFIPATNVQYSGLAPTLVGVWQINVLVPSTAPSGSSVPIAVFMNSIPSNNAGSSPTITTTIGIK